MTRIYVMTVAVSLCVMVSACATPPAFVKASPATSEQLERIRNSDCPQLFTDLAFQESIERILADDMSSRATKQALLNVFAVGTMAVGGFGMVYSPRGESGYRESLANIRGQVDAMKSVIAEKGCRPPAPATAP
jgi:hypothetical protein